MTSEQLIELARLVEASNYHGEVGWMLNNYSLSDIPYTYEEEELGHMRKTSYAEHIECGKKSHELYKKSNALRASLPKDKYGYQGQNDETRALEQEASELNTKSWRKRWESERVPWLMEDYNQIGKCVRLMHSLFGAHTYTSAVSDWAGVQEKVIGWKNNDIGKVLDANTKLIEAGIKRFSISSLDAASNKTGQIRISIRIPAEIYPQVFLKSDDPEVWKTLQKKKEESLKKRRTIREVENLLDRGQ